MARKKNKPLPPIEWLLPRVKIVRLLSLVLLFALAGLLLVWNLWFANLHGARPWVVISVELIPLLLVAPGMLLGSAYVHAWACFLMNLYFVQGVLTWIDPARAWKGAAETLLSVALFIAALLYTRWRSQLTRIEAGAEQSTTAS